MKTAPFKTLFGDASRWAKDNCSHILTALGLTSMAGAVVSAVKVTPKAKELINAAEEEKGEPLTAVEKVKTTWKCYILPAGCFTIGTVCIIGSDVKNAKANAGLATTAAMAQTALRTYQEKVVETIGEQKEKEVRENARKEISEKHDIPYETTAIIMGGEKVHCVDCMGNEFDADPDDIQRAVNEVNNTLNNFEYSSLNELYDSIPGAEETVVGSYMGFNRIHGLVGVRTTAALKRGKPVLLVTYSPLPVYNFDRS